MMYTYTIFVPSPPLFLFFGLHTQKKNDAEKQKRGKVWEQGYVHTLEGLSRLFL